MRKSNFGGNLSSRLVYDHNIHQQNQSSEQRSTSSATRPISEFTPTTPKSPPNPMWVSKDRAYEHEELNGGFNANKDDVQEDDGDVVTRLEKLRMFGEEPDLSEELLKYNDQLQQDEVLAIEAIYGENIVILDNQNGLRSFQIHIYIDTPEELTISTKPNSPQNINTDTSSSEGFSYSFEVKYIPPIILTCVLPKSYPTRLPPYFTISVQWLDSSVISRLCLMLDSIWEEQHGQEVIYSWAEWLHTCAISYLGFNKEIVLGPYGVKDQGDPRALSGCVSPDVDVPSSKSYSEEQRLEFFLKTLQECCICFGEFAGAEFIRLPCQHFFCQERQSSSQLKGKQRKHEQEMIHELLSVRAILRDAKQCPSCKMAISKTEGCNKMFCQNCGKYFCYRCNKAVEGYDHFRDGTCELFPQEEIQNWEEHINPQQHIDQIQATLFHEHGHPCPQCGEVNVKVGKNNHIFCWACLGRYCYLCRKMVKRGSQHFGPKGCKQHTDG